MLHHLMQKKAPHPQLLVPAPHQLQRRQRPLDAHLPECGYSAQVHATLLMAVSIAPAFHPHTETIKDAKSISTFLGQDQSMSKPSELKADMTSW